MKNVKVVIIFEIEVKSDGHLSFLCERPDILSDAGFYAILSGKGEIFLCGLEKLRIIFYMKIEN